MKTIFDNLNNGVSRTDTVVKVVDYRKLKVMLTKGITLSKVLE